MKVKIIISFLVFLSFICLYYIPDNEKSEEKLSPLAFKLRNSVIKEQTEKKSVNDSAIIKNIFEKKRGNYIPLYIGQFKDTFSLLNINKIQKYCIYDNLEQYKSPELSKISIFLDKTKKIIKPFLKFLENGKHIKKYQEAFIMFIVNISNDTLSVGYRKRLPIILEALDKDKIWKPIEKIFTLECGMALETIILPPNEILITAVPIYDGNFKTKLRLRYGYDTKIFSQEFEGKINLEQFENKEMNDYY